MVGKYLKIPLIISLLTILFPGCTEEKILEFEIEIPTWLDGEWYSAEDGRGDDPFIDIPYGSPANPRFSKRIWKFDIASNQLIDIQYRGDDDSEEIREVYNIEWLAKDKYCYPQIPKKLPGGWILIPSIPEEYDTPYLDYMAYGVFTKVSTGESHTLRIWRVKGADNITHFVIGPCNTVYQPVKEFMFLSDLNDRTKMASAILSLSRSKRDYQIDGYDIEVYCSGIEMKKYNLNTNAANIVFTDRDHYSFHTEDENIILKKIKVEKDESINILDSYRFRTLNIRGLNLEFQQADSLGVTSLNEIFKTSFK